ncbi:MAG TPA: response regulator [Candidatus Omnitrophota bacterium]|nr:response regulator [Candidatus Omnitrophota bacterium]
MDKKVLVIEDESDISRPLAFRLKKKGLETLIAVDGEEGLAMAKREKPDLVILDLMLPKLPGEEVCKQIRQDESIGNVPILMLTAKASDIDKVVGKTLGATSYMTKPFEANELLREIDRLLKKTPGS